MSYQLSECHPAYHQKRTSHVLLAVFAVTTFKIVIILVNVNTNALTLTSVQDEHRTQINCETRLGCKMEFYTSNCIMNVRGLDRGQCNDNDLLP